MNQKPPHRPMSSCCPSSTITLNNNKQHIRNIYFPPTSNPNLKYPKYHNKTTTQSKHSTQNNSYRPPSAKPLSSKHQSSDHPLKQSHQSIQPPQLNTNSIQLPDKILFKNVKRNTPYFNSSCHTSSDFQKYKINDYIEMMNNRKQRIKEIEERNAKMQIKHKGILLSSYQLQRQKQQRSKSTIKIKEIKRIPPTHMSTVSSSHSVKNQFNINNKVHYNINRSNFNSNSSSNDSVYMKYNVKEVFGVRNKFHTYYNSKLYNNNNRYNTNTQYSSVNSKQNMITSNNNNNNGDSGNLNEEFTFKEPKDTEQPVKIKVTNTNDIHCDSNSNIVNNNKVNELNDNKLIQSLQRNNENNFNKASAAFTNNIGRDKITKRKNDLNQFMRFTDGVISNSSSNSNNNNKQHQPIIKQRYSNAIIPISNTSDTNNINNSISKQYQTLNVKPHSNAYFKMNDDVLLNPRMKVIDHNDNYDDDDYNNQERDMNIDNDDIIADMKLNSRSKAFAQERLMLIEHDTQEYE